MQYSLWLSWSWLHHPAHWLQLSPGSGSCTCWSPAPASASLWQANHVVTIWTTIGGAGWLKAIIYIKCKGEQKGDAFTYLHTHSCEVPDKNHYIEMM